jgi:hypothetical protein
MQRKQVFCISSLLSFSFLFLCTSAKSQVALLLNELSSFQNPSPNWRIAGNATADLKENGVLRISEGAGVLANLPEKKGTATDLYTVFQHSDIDLELDYMMAKGSNSGIYLQGRYEVQLLDSWGVKNPAAGDNGGIYERWDEARGKGAEGYQGYAPRQNASRAPGLWQHLKISFQAPRFDASGKKIENARMLRVVLNGVTIHENVELLGPTRGGPHDEAALGPLRIQGDHGAVAFRNIVYTNFNASRPELANLTYKIYKGKFEKEPEFAKLPPEAQGSTTILSSDINKIDNEFIIRYTGTLEVKAAGDYHFNLRAPGGNGLLKINNKVVVPMGEWGSGKATLPVGKLPFELSYAKYVSWTKAALALSLSGPGIREYMLSDINTGVNDVVDPILIDANVNTTLRSFMDIPSGKRIVHAVNVGTAQQLHFTYDLDRGMLVQAWRGGFLDATPMWHDRGDGSSRPIGAVLHFGQPAFLLQKLANAQSPWNNDTAGTAFRPRGYEMDEADLPAFLYSIYGADITDDIKVLDNREGLRRTLTLQNAGEGLYVRLAEGKTIEPLADGLYLIDDKSYYLQIEEAGKAKPVIRDANGRKELIIPVQTKLTYSVLF